MSAIAAPVAVGRLFLHFFDVHFLDLKGITRAPAAYLSVVKAEARLATRLALVAADLVLVPAASYAESTLCRHVIDEFQDLFALGLIRTVGGGASMEEFTEDKLSQYSRGTHQHNKYRSLLKGSGVLPPFRSRKASATKDIASGWLNRLKGGDVSRRLLDGSGVSPPRDLERQWEKVPIELGGNAFVVDNVIPLLFKGPINRVVRNRLHDIVNSLYFASFTRELRAGVITDLVYLESPTSVPSFGQDLPYFTLVQALRQNGLLKRITTMPPIDLMNVKATGDWQAALATAVANLEQKYNITEATRMQGEIGRTLREASVGVITALPEEYASAYSILECAEEIKAPGRGAGRAFAIAKITNDFGSTLTVAVAMLTEMGNNSAAIAASSLLHHCPNVKHIIMCGIAGAVPNVAKPADHVRLGDIVVSNANGVVQYDNVKEETDKITHRHPPRPPAAELLEAVKFLHAGQMRGIRPWDKYIEEAPSRLEGDDWERPPEGADSLREGPGGASLPHPADDARVPGKPRVFSGPIASANILLKNPDKRNAIRDRFGVKAVEMEGSGVADAAWSLEAGYLVVRGTCDYCNSYKDDRWHPYAAIVAAAYTRCVIEKISG